MDHRVRSQNDLRFRGEKRLLGLLEDAGRTCEYNQLLSKIIAANKDQRFDLVVSVAAEKVFVHIENKRWEKADETFRGAMQKLASKAGGHLFYQLVQPYVQSCLEEGKSSYAQAAMERAANRSRRRPAPSSTRISRNSPISSRPGPGLKGLLKNPATKNRVVLLCSFYAWPRLMLRGIMQIPFFRGRAPRPRRFSL